MEIYAAAYRISCNNRSRVIDTVNGRRGSDLSSAIVMLNALFLQLSAALFIKKLIVGEGYNNAFRKLFHFHMHCSTRRE